MTQRTRTGILAGLAATGVAFRLLLCWYNPPVNTFDNHFTPIKLILATWRIPNATECVECYHPPVFYLVSAVIARVALALGLAPDPLLKLLQFVNCGYAIATVGVVFLILRKLRMSARARLLVFGTLCLLPRHIYLSALHGNDCMGILFVCVCAFLCLDIIDRGPSLVRAVALSAAVTVAIFIKHSGWVVVPMVAICWLSLDWCAGRRPAARTLLPLGGIMAIPLLLLAVSLRHNVQTVGQALPYNDQASVNQPRAERGVTYFDFKPWKFVATPIVVPDQSWSFWTLLYCGMWFDTEPKFLFATDVNWPWWMDYAAWVRGEQPFPQAAPPLSAPTRLLAASLITLGGVPLLCILFGLLQAGINAISAQTAGDRREAAKFAMLMVLLAANVAGVAVIARRLPVFTSLKASFLLNSLPLLSLCLGNGLTAMERHPRLSRGVGALFCLLFGLCALHIGRILLGLRALGT